MKSLKLAHRSQKGFTLIEILVVIGIIAILAAITVVAINPARQFGQANDTTRTSDISAILNAIGQNIADNKGTFTCGTVTLPTTATEVGTASGDIDLTCLTPTYIAALPLDPKGGTAASTKYKVMQDATTKRVTLTATPEVATSISITR